MVIKVSYRKSRTQATLFIYALLLIVMGGAAVALAARYMGAFDQGPTVPAGASQQTSSDGTENESSAVSEEQPGGETSSSGDASSEIITDDDPLVNAHNTTKGSEEFPYYICVNRKQNMIIVYTMDDDGYYTVPYKAFVCSVGLPDPENDGAVNTPIGTFNTTNQYTWRLLEGNVYGQYATRIVDHILFHSVPYYEQSKDTLEWEEYNKLGQAASLGCIRMTVEDAKWIYDNCPKGTTVTIYESDKTEPFEKPEAQKIPEDSPYRGWDPTDPDPENPWNS